jgi:hypothetical protein
MEVYTPSTVPRSLSPVRQYSNTPVLSPSSPSFSSPSRHKLKREYTTPLKMDPYGYDNDAWNSFIYNMDTDGKTICTLASTYILNGFLGVEHQRLFEQENMNAPQPYTIYPTPYGVSQGNPNQGM